MLRVSLLFLLIVGFATAEDWTQFRGPRGDGISAEKAIPADWSASKNILWKVEIPGIGHSSPIVSKGKVFVTTCLVDSLERRLLCLDRTDGKLLWQQTLFAAPLEKRHANSTCANSTPATDGTRVISTFLRDEKFVVFCHDFSGKELWMVSPGRYVNSHGLCSSPIFACGLVYLGGDNDEAGFVVALDPATGKVVWRHDRATSIRSFSVPVFVPDKDNGQLVLSGNRAVTGFDPKTGKVLWAVKTETEKFVAAAVAVDGVIFATGTSPVSVSMAIDPDAKATGDRVVWQDAKNACYTCSPVASDKLVFGVTDNGMACCTEARTGKRLWAERLGKKHHASAVRIGDRVLFCDQDGVTHIVRASEKFEAIAKPDLGEGIHATPAISEGRLFIRTEKHLFCIGE